MSKISRKKTLRKGLAGVLISVGTLSAGGRHLYWWGDYVLSFLIIAGIMILP